MHLQKTLRPAPTSSKLIVEKVLEKPKFWALPKDSIYLDPARIRMRCDASTYTLKQQKECKHQTLGEWLMDFVLSEVQVL